jgi:Rhodopirellula transposase DDE domain
MLSRAGRFGSRRGNRVVEVLQPENWRGRPLVSREVIINLISSTATAKGLKIQACLDTNRYPKGIKVSAQVMRSVRIQPAAFHGEWNYTVLPRKKRRETNISEKQSLN